MPNIVSSEVTTDHIRIVASDGASVQITATTVLALQNQLAQSDMDATRAVVIAQVQLLISQALGESNVLPDQISFDYDQSTGSPTSLGFSG